jgi:hypothetical protein
LDDPTPGRAGGELAFRRAADAVAISFQSA